MGRSSKLPTPQEHARLWADLDFSDRRRIFRAVNRGEGMTNRKQARIAVGAARQQLRYWRWAWLFGPAMGLVRIPDWAAVGVTAVLGTLLMGGISLYRIRRASAAEQANLERLGIARREEPG